jgi:hypothetical protein
VSDIGLDSGAAIETSGDLLLVVRGAMRRAIAGRPRGAGNSGKPFCDQGPGDGDGPVWFFQKLEHFAPA